MSLKRVGLFSLQDRDGGDWSIVSFFQGVITGDLGARFIAGFGEMLIELSDDVASILIRICLC